MDKTLAQLVAEHVLENMRDMLAYWHEADEDENHPDTDEGASDCDNCYCVARFLDWLEEGHD